MNEKNWGVTDHRACLGDIVQNIARMGVFFSFSKDTQGNFYKSWLKSNKFQTFQLILLILNLTV